MFSFGKMKKAEQKLLSFGNARVDYLSLLRFIICV
jgi:hypothetical protein